MVNEFSKLKCGLHTVFKSAPSMFTKLSLKLSQPGERTKHHLPGREGGEGEGLGE